MFDRCCRLRFVALFLTALLCPPAASAAERVVDLTAADGLELKATYFPAAAPGPGVLLLHQCNRQRKVWDDLARQLSARGLHVLTLDYRGYGESGGEPFDKLPQQEAAQLQREKWPGDIDTAFNHLVSQPGVKKDTIGVGGASCGVDNSVQTARRHPEVKSLVLLSGTTDLNGRKFLRTTRLPVFFSVADDDEFEPTVLLVQWLYSLTGTAGKRLAHYAKGGHGSDMFSVQPQLPGLIADWYVQTLIKTPGHAPASSDTPKIPAEVNVLNEIDQPNGAATFARKLEEARKSNPKAQPFPEDIVNFVGYEHLQAGDTKAAVAIMKLNAQAYPESANVYDSLSDAYLADGQQDLARENAEKALQLLESGTTSTEERRNAIRTSAEGKLKRLKAPGGQARADSCSTITQSNIDDCVRLNQIQVLGTHNSYHIAPAAQMLSILGPRARNIEYTHRPIAEQLSRLGVRKLELDVFADPEGGRYASPAAFRMLNGSAGALPPLSGAELAALRQPGFKVLHTQDIDYRTTCLTLNACLTDIRDWSRANPRHVPIFVMIEAKDSPLDDPRGVGYVKPLRIGIPELRALDDEIRAVFDASHVLTPDRVRGRHATLSEAIRTDGWPTLRESRGKILFGLDNLDGHRTDYLKGSPSLEGRMIFVSSNPGEPSAAFVKMNEALGEEEDRIRQAVRDGFIVRTRADIPTDEARSGSTVRRDTAFRSGAQYVSTDYPEPSPFGSGYVARLPGAERLAARCNPVNAPRGCRSEWLEPPVH
jgi:dienelactone hydrolase